MTKRERVRKEQEERLTGICRHLGTTVEDEARTMYGQRLHVDELSGRQLYDLTTLMWERQHERDRQALAQFDNLTKEEQSAVFDALLR